MRTVLTALLLLPLPALAVGPDYTYSQGSIAHVDIEDVDKDTNFQLAAGLGLPGDFYLYGDYTRVNLEQEFPTAPPGGIVVEETTAIANLGMGYTIPVAPITDLNFEAGWIRSSGFLRPLRGKETNNGVRAAFGVRSTVAPFVELGARAGYTYEGPVGNDFFVSGNALFKLFGPVAINLEALTYAGDVNVYTAGLRVGF